MAMNSANTSMIALVILMTAYATRLAAGAPYGFNKVPDTKKRSGSISDTSFEDLFDIGEHVGHNSHTQPLDSRKRIATDYLDSTFSLSNIPTLEHQFEMGIYSHFGDRSPYQAFIPPGSNDDSGIILGYEERPPSTEQPRKARRPFLFRTGGTRRFQSESVAPGPPPPPQQQQEVGVRDILTTFDNPENNFNQLLLDYDYDLK